jgi:hypothetical protein
MSVPNWPETGWKKPSVIRGALHCRHQLKRKKMIELGTERGHQGSFRIDKQSSRGQCQSIGHALLRIVQADEPALGGQHRRKRQPAPEKEHERERSTDQGGIDAIGKERFRPEPKTCGGEQLGVPRRRSTQTRKGRKSRQAPPTQGRHGARYQTIRSLPMAPPRRRRRPAPRRADSAASW